MSLQAFGFSIEPAATEFFECTLMDLHFIHDGQNRPTNGDKGFLAASTRRQATVLRGQIRVLRMAGCPGALRQRGPQPAVPRTRRALLAFARRLIIARAHTGPRAQM